ncbi:GspE/PulE family protein [Bowmanella denitrificans]|uniref:GspE/PulE family protein n=1 Tax=Bowmanella denitrificans TaxID=366582 RepID=A0ABP3GWZ2_9ALTE
MPISYTVEQFESVLLDAGVSQQDLEKAKTYQRKFGGEIEQLLLNLGALAEEQLTDIYASLLSTPVLDNLDGLEKQNEIGLNETFLLSRKWLALNRQANVVRFITSQPLNWDVQQYLELTEVEPEILLCNDALFEQARSLWFESVDGIARNKDEVEGLSDTEEDRLRELASEAPTVNLLNSLISKGLKLGASDMHIEPVESRARVRYRIDGVLHDLDTIPRRLQLPVVSRLKILSGMDIAEKRRPQDGKIELKIANTELDIRVSALPLNDGESVVLRFLRKDSVRYDMEVLGLAPDIQQWLDEDLTHTAGVILLTGPTGSGKTTTLYTFLNKLNSDQVKIITLEDPVEYQLDGVNQVQVNADIGFTFAAGLRSIVRQDPDVIMVGEIRDKESAQIAMQSALTGHLVFSTVHTNDAPSAYTRLIDLGVEEFLLNAAIVSIVAQRLARKLCPHCAKKHPEALELIDKYGLTNFASKDEISLLAPVGCDRCDNTGYKGRTAIVEYLRCDDKLRALDKGSGFVQAAKALNKDLGRRTLLEDGLLKAVRGITSIEEVIRVAG